MGEKDFRKIFEGLPPRRPTPEVIVNGNVSLELDEPASIQPEKLDRLPLLKKLQSLLIDNSDIDIVVAPLQIAINELESQILKDGRPQTITLEPKKTKAYSLIGNRKKRLLNLYSNIANLIDIYPNTIPLEIINLKQNLAKALIIAKQLPASETNPFAKPPKHKTQHLSPVKEPISEPFWKKLFE